MDTKGKIFLIEDEDYIIEMYRTQFELAGYSFNASKNEREGWDEIKKIKPDLLLLDLILPSKDEPVDVYDRAGYRLLRKVRNDKEFKAIPVVILTNLDSKQERETSKELGATDYWVKAQKFPKDVVSGVEEILKMKT